MSEQPRMAFLRLDIEQLRQSVMIAVQDHHAALYQDMRAAVEHACSDGTVQQTIREAVQRELVKSVTAEIESFFRYGEGRKAIAAIVAQRMLNVAKPQEEQR